MKNLYVVVKKDFVRNEQGNLKLVADLISDEPMSRYFAKKIADIENDRSIMTVEMFNRELKSGFLHLV
jgi:hypothetical protein